MVGQWLNRHFMAGKKGRNSSLGSHKLNHFQTHHPQICWSWCGVVRGHGVIPGGMAGVAPGSLRSKKDSRVWVPGNEYSVNCILKTVDARLLLFKYATPGPPNFGHRLPEMPPFSFLPVSSTQ